MNVNVPSIDPVALRRRNRRLAIWLVLAVAAMTLLCAAYINWYGGTNKPPMKPFHSLGATHATPDTA